MILTFDQLQNTSLLKSFLKIAKKYQRVYIPRISVHLFLGIDYRKNNSRFLLTPFLKEDDSFQ